MKKIRRGGKGKRQKKTICIKPVHHLREVIFFFKPLQKLFFVQMPYDLYEFKNLEIKVILNKGLL